MKFGLFQGCARDLLSRDWTRPETHAPETRPRCSKFCSRWDRDEAFKIQVETEMRRCSFWDAGRDLEAPETIESLGSFNVSSRRFPWRMVKHWQWKMNYAD